MFYIGLSCFIVQLLFKKKNFDFITSNFIIHRAFFVLIFVFTLCKVVNSGIEFLISEFLEQIKIYLIFMWAYQFIYFSRFKFDYLRKALILALLVSVFYGCMQSVGLDLFYRMENGRLCGFQGNSYTYAGQLIALLFFVIEIFFFEKHNSKRFLYFLLILLTIFCVLSSGQRAVIASMYASLILFLVVKYLKWKPFLRSDYFYLFWMFSIPIVLLKIVNSPTVIKRVRKVFYLHENSENIRLQLWELALTLWKKNIFFGSGFYPTVHHITPKKVQYLSHAHSIYFHTLAVSGLFGFFALVNLFVSFIYVGLINLSKNKFALSSLCVIFAFLLEGIFEYNFGDSEVRNLLFFVLAVTYANFDNK